MDKVEELQEKLIEIVEEEMEKPLCEIKTCELGAVIDMIKDFSEAMYYYNSAKAMQHGGTQVTQIVTPGHSGPIPVPAI